MTIFLVSALQSDVMFTILLAILFVTLGYIRGSTVVSKSYKTMIANLQSQLAALQQEIATNHNVIGLYETLVNTLQENSYATAVKNHVVSTSYKTTIANLESQLVALRQEIGANHNAIGLYETLVNTFQDDSYATAVKNYVVTTAYKAIIANFKSQLIALRQEITANHNAIGLYEILVSASQDDSYETVVKDYAVKEAEMLKLRDAYMCFTVFMHSLRRQAGTALSRSQTEIQRLQV